jgi:serine/threonine-protein kinase HipA
LFGVPSLPVIDVEVAKLHTLALAMVGRTTLAGVQKKLSVRLDRGATLRVGVDGLAFILKPPADTFPGLVQNEHLSMRLASEVGIEVPPNALVPMKDGQIAYLVRRFDRLEHRKLFQEDFCQLNRKPAKDRYLGSLEQCAETVRRFATEPGIEAQKFFRYAVFSWWIGNGDLHLKNLSLLRSEEGFWRLSPAYDLLSTVVFLPEDQLALSVGGTKKIRSTKKWLGLAKVCGLPERAARRILDDIAKALDPCEDLISRSTLPDDQKKEYRRVLTERTALLKGAAAPEDDLTENVPEHAMALRNDLLREHPGLTNMIVKPTEQTQPLWDYLVERGHAVHRMGGYALKNWLPNLDD